MRRLRNKAMARKCRLIDRRLLGTWKSDRRKTFRYFTPLPKATPAGLRKLKNMFGKLIVRYGRHQYYTEYNGSTDATRYELVATDSSSVVIRVFRDEPDVKRYGKIGRNLLLDLFPREELVQIHFEDKWYWVWAWGDGLREYFRRVDDRQRINQ